jgi:hypothetical protein
MPKVIVVSEVIVVAPEVAAVPEIAAEQVVDTEYQDKASASNITTDADDLLPPPLSFTVPPMEWLLGRTSAGWLVDDPERDFSDDELTAPPLPMHYYMRHGYGPRLPSMIPSDEEQEHFAPPGYALVTEFIEPPFAIPADAPPTAPRTGSGGGEER